MSARIDSPCSGMTSFKEITMHTSQDRLAQLTTWPPMIFIPDISGSGMLQPESPMFLTLKSEKGITSQCETVRGATKLHNNS